MLSTKTTTFTKISIPKNKFLLFNKLSYEFNTVSTAFNGQVFMPRTEIYFNLRQPDHFSAYVSLKVRASSASKYIGESKAIKVIEKLKLGAIQKR